MRSPRPSARWASVVPAGALRGGRRSAIASIRSTGTVAPNCAASPAYGSATAPPGMNRATSRGRLPHMRQRISLITLGVRDLARARRFYGALGWRTGAEAGDDVVFFQAGDMVLAL